MSMTTQGRLVVDAHGTSLMDFANGAISD